MARPPAEPHISCLFSKRGKDVQINKRRSYDSVSCWRSRSGRQPWISLRGALRLFSAMAAPLACLGQPTYVARSGKRVKKHLFLSLAALSETLSPPFRRLCFGGSSPPRAHALRVELFLYGKLRLIAAPGLCGAQWLPCSGAPRFLN